MEMKISEFLKVVTINLAPILFAAETCREKKTRLTSLVGFEERHYRMRYKLFTKEIYF